MIFYDKTEKGREEISSRKYQLPSKLRPLLVMIDGKHSSEELLKRLAGIGLTEGSLQQLLKLGLIAPMTAPVLETGTKESEAISHFKAQSNVKHEAEPELQTVQESSKEPETFAQHLAAIRQFFTQTIRGNLGLRGFALQLKVERADSLEDFMALSEDYVEALYKTKGQQAARTLEGRLAQLISNARECT